MISYCLDWSLLRSSSLSLSLSLSLLCFRRCSFKIQQVQVVGNYQFWGLALSVTHTHTHTHTHTAPLILRWDNIVSLSWGNAIPHSLGKIKIHWTLALAWKCTLVWAALSSLYLCLNLLQWSNKFFYLNSCLNILFWKMWTKKTIKR